MKLNKNGTEFDVKKTIAANITYLREQAGLSKAEIAKKLNVNQSSVSHWESGANSIDINRLFQLCEILGCSIQEMYTPMWARLDDNGVKNNDLTLFIDDFDNKKHSLDNVPLTHEEHDMFLSSMEIGIEHIRRSRSR